VGELSESVGSPNGAAIVEVEGLVKRYRKGKTNAVDGISFTVRQGEFFAFLGPNGAGKTGRPLSAPNLPSLGERDQTIVVASV
jgi:ABC-type oligopeptide transport system ATPase subunit